jgi:alkylhydroperoxidase/carboxymuconolactone decarboxylase family protein YurZ
MNLNDRMKVASGYEDDLPPEDNTEFRLTRKAYTEQGTSRAQLIQCVLDLAARAQELDQIGMAAALAGVSCVLLHKEDSLLAATITELVQEIEEKNEDKS